MAKDRGVDVVDIFPQAPSKTNLRTWARAPRLVGAHRLTLNASRSTSHERATQFMVHACTLDMDIANLQQ